MFSGIIKEIGIVSEITNNGSDITMIIKANKLINMLEIGDSISVNGCCLTICEINANTFKVEVVAETIDKTNLQYLKPYSNVNLEGSITANQSIGGHFVQGHVSNTAQIISIEDIGNSRLVNFAYPPSLTPYIVDKGYVALDGMSITVIEAKDEKFSVTFVPYTLANTIAHQYDTGSLVNLEVDIIGRYIEKLIPYRK